MVWVGCRESEINALPVLANGSQLVERGQAADLQLQQDAA
jgi:hypothetical protein